MGIGISIFLIAVGAIMRFAVHVSTTGFSVHSVGMILLVVGVIGLVVSLLWASMAGRRGGPVVGPDGEPY